MRAAVVLALSLAACATVREAPVYYADGRPAFLAQCRAIEDCHAAARERCGAYLPLDERQSSRTSPIVGNATGVVGGGSRTEFRLTYRCQ